MKLVDDGKRSKKSQKVVQKHSVPKMPEGYYSGDKPNPNLRKFVEDHLKEHPYDPETDDYDIPAFDKPIETTKATAIYNMHTYWSKKPHDAIRQYIRHYTKPGDLVLDPFCGSGGTALAALMEGRAAIAIDRSPAATFITKNYCTPVDVEELQATFEELKEKVKPEIDLLYETKCDRCGGKAKINFTVYSQVFQCPRCSEKIPLYDCIEVWVPAKTQKKGKPEKKIKSNACPYCYKKGHVEVIRSQSKKYGYVPVLSNYHCYSNKCPDGERKYNDENAEKREFFRKFDLEKLKEIETGFIPHKYPKNYDMTKFSRYQRDALYYYGIKEVSDLFTKRNLWSISIINEKINGLKYSDIFKFALTGVCLALSKMQRYSPNSGFPNMILLGTYYIPQIGREIEVFSWYEGKVKSLIKGLSKLDISNSELMISTENAYNLNIPSNSVDYIFTDPPYSDNVQYGELNYVWEAWLGFNAQWLDDEIIVNEQRGKSVDDWAYLMIKAMKECYRVLKPGRWISLCYHDTSEGTWALLQDIMAEAGFIPDCSNNSLYIDTSQKSFNQLNADKVNKRDLVINFRKPNYKEVSVTYFIKGEEDSQTFSEKVRIIIRDYLTDNPGSTKDRIYDNLISRMVRSGQLESHNFDQFLQEIAEPTLNETPSRWYLKSEEIETIDQAESEKEDYSAQKIRTFITSYLKENPEAEGVHYSNLFEHYLYAVPQTEKPRRQLADWLGDYFYKTPEGTWRLPATEEEEKVRAEGRKKGIARRIRHYLNILEKGLTIRDGPDNRQLVEWIHHCRRAGMYAEGRRLYETGGLRLEALPEDLQVEVEEDYETCIRLGTRQQKEKPKRTRKKKGE